MNDDQHIHFLAPTKDYERLEAIRARLELTKSEVCRRALRLGLDRLERTKIPGAYNKATPAISD